MSDEREMLLKSVALKVLLPPTIYPPHRKAFGDIEAWFICAKSEHERAQIVSCASSFAQTCKGGRVEFEGVKYKVSCNIGRGLIIFDTRA